MSWGFLQARASTFSGTGTTIPLAFSTAVTPGSLLVAFLSSSTGNATGVSDPTNGAWTQFPTGSSITNSTKFASAWYLQNNQANTAITVTAAMGATVGSRQIVIAEYSGIMVSGAMDVSAGQGQTNPGTGTDAVSSGNTAASAVGNELAVCATLINNDSPTLTPGTGFGVTRATANNATTSIKCALEDRNVPSAGTAVAGTWTTNSSTVDALTIVGLFKEIPVSGGPDHYYRMMRDLH